jgi:hypothetical protein
MPLTPTLVALRSFSIASLTCVASLVSLSAHAQPSSPSVGEPKMNEAFLVPAQDIERHNLSPMERSLLHVSLRFDSLTYFEADQDSQRTFVGVGGPNLSYKRLRWRSFTLWLDNDESVQFESALSIAVMSPKDQSAWYMPKDLTVGVHAGLQDIPSYDNYDSIDYYDYDYYEDDSGFESDKELYRSPEAFYYGLQVAAYYSSGWIELSCDFSEVITEYDWWRDMETELMLTRVGLSVGFSFL